MVTPRCEPPSTSPHFLCCWGHRPLILWGTGTEQWGELFFSFPSSYPLHHVVGSQHVAGCAHCFSALLALHRLSRVGSFLPLPVSGVVGTPGRTDLPTPPLPCLCVSFLCVLMSLSPLRTQALGLGLFCSNVSSS